MDVLVAGGGPAGSTCAALLADKGYRVALLERCRAPRHNVGDSLFPAVLALLRANGFLGLGRSIGVLPLFRREVWWAKEEPDVLEHEPPRGPLGIQVWRQEFDGALLTRASDRGVRVLMGWNVAGIEGLEEGAPRVRSRDPEGASRDLPCRFFVDATGRGAILSRIVGRTLTLGDWRSIGITGYWTGAENHPLAPAVIESYEGGWAWSAPVPRDLRNVTLFVDFEDGASWKRDHCVKRYHAELDRTRRIRSLIAGAKLMAPIWICEASAYRAGQVADKQFLLIGDAAVAIDPLSSQGVLKAMSSATEAAAVIHTILDRPVSCAAAIQYHEEREQFAFQDHVHAALAFYRKERRYPESEFWRKRAEASTGSAVEDAVPAGHPVDLDACRDARLEVPAGVEICEGPARAGDYVEWGRVVSSPMTPRGVGYVGPLFVPALVERARSGVTVRECLQELERGNPGAPPAQIREALIRVIGAGLIRIW